MSNNEIVIKREVIDMRKEKKKKSKKRKISDDIVSPVKSMHNDENDIKREIVNNSYKKETNSDDIADSLERMPSNENDIKKETRKKSKKRKISNDISSVKSMHNDENDIKREIVNNSYKKETNSDDIADSLERMPSNENDIKKEARKKSKKRKISNDIVSPVKSMHNDENDIKREIVNNSYKKVTNSDDIADSLERMPSNENDIKKKTRKKSKKRKISDDIVRPVKSMHNNENSIKREIVNNSYKKETNSDDIADSVENISSSDTDIKREIVGNKCDDITYLANRIREKEAISQEDSIKLLNLNIQLIHEVPPQHQIEVRSGTHAPTREELERFKAIVKLTNGRFSSHEDDTIVHNWKQFCKLHNWNKENSGIFLNLIDSNNKYICKKKSLKKFVQFLAKDLPDRTLFSVYHRFKILYSLHVIRRYTQEENEIILNYIDQKQYVNEKRKFVDLAKVLNRSRASVWRHYRLLKRNHKDESDLD